MVALSGLALSLFLVMHLSGNLMLLVDAQKFNQYAHSLASFGPLLWAAEIGLVLVFLLHIVMAIRLTFKNWAARPEAYAIRESTGRSRRFWGSSSMHISGAVVLAFLVYHIFHFKFGSYIPTISNGVEIRDLATTVKSEFKEWEEVLFYVVSLLLLGAHLRHGFRSLFDTLGIVPSHWDLMVSRICFGFVFIVIGGFILIPVWIFFCGSAGG